MRCQDCENQVEVAPRFCDACGAPLARPESRLPEGEPSREHAETLTFEATIGSWAPDTMQFGWTAGPAGVSDFGVASVEGTPAVDQVPVDPAPEPPPTVEAAEPAPPPWWVAQRSRLEAESPVPDLHEDARATGVAASEPSTVSSGASPGATSNAMAGAAPGAASGGSRPRPAIVRLPTTASAPPRGSGRFDPDWAKAAAVAVAAAIVVSGVGLASVRYWARIDHTTTVGSQQPEPVLSFPTIDTTVLNSPSPGLNAPSLDSPTASPTSSTVHITSDTTGAPGATNPGRTAEGLGERARKTTSVPPTAPRRTARAKRAASAAPAAPPATAAPEAEPAPLVARQGAVVVEPAALPQAPVSPASPATLSSAGAAFEPNQVDVRPQVVHSVDPRYPDHLRERGPSDVVIVRVLVTLDGRPSDMRVLRPSRVDPALDRAALAAVTEWRFSPARKRDRPVACWFNVGVAFRPASENAGY